MLIPRREKWTRDGRRSCQKNGLEKFNIFPPQVGLPSTIETYFHELWEESCGVVKTQYMSGGGSDTAGWNLDDFLWPRGTKAESNIEFYDLRRFLFKGFVIWNVFIASNSPTNSHLIAILMWKFSFFLPSPARIHYHWPHNLHLFTIFCGR